MFLIVIFCHNSFSFDFGSERQESCSDCGTAIRSCGSQSVMFKPHALVSTMTFSRIQISRNRETRHCRDNYQAHRAKVMGLILQAGRLVVRTDAAVLPTLTVLGAGNCLDLDLPELVAAFSRIHLVDIDREAVERPVGEFSGGSPAAAGMFQIHAPVDIASPMMDQQPLQSDPAASGQKSGGAQTAGLPHELLDLLQAVGGSEIPAEIPVTDVVVSTCLLSQLVETLSAIVNPKIPQYAMAVQALRIGHVKRMLALCRPGGSILLVTDLVSSDTLPELKRIPLNELNECVKTGMQAGNFFTGCNPELVLRDLQILAHATGRMTRIVMHEPWLWNVGDRTYAVYAVQAMLKSTSDVTHDTNADSNTEIDQGRPDLR